MSFGNTQNDPYFNDMEKIPLVARKEETKLARLIARGNKAKQKFLKDVGCRKNPAVAEETLSDLIRGRAPKLKLKGKETVLIDIIKTGEIAKQDLASANLRLVVSIAKKYARNSGSMDFSDLIEQGNLGLMIALNRFDLSFGVKFATYATWWIMQSITRALPEQGRIVRIPSGKIKEIAKVNKARDKLWHILKHEPSEEEIALEMGETVKYVQTVKKAHAKIFSIESSAENGSEKFSGNSFQDQNIPSSAQTSYRFSVTMVIKDTLATLPYREREMICMRFGLNDGIEHTLEEVGLAFHISRERIRQILERVEKVLEKNSCLQPK